MFSRRRARASEHVAVGAIAAAAALALSHSIPRAPATGTTATGTTRRWPPTLRGRTVHFVAHGRGDALTIEREDGTIAAELELALRVNGAPYPFELQNDAPIRGVVSGTTRVRAAEKTLELRTDVFADAARDALILRVSAPSQARDVEAQIAVRTKWIGAAPQIFVSGVGPVSGDGEVSGAAAVTDARPLAIGAASTDGAVFVRRSARAPGNPDAASELTIFSPVASSGHPQAELHVAVGPSTGSLWQTLMEIGQIPTAAVRGRVMDAGGEPADVVGRDARGAPRVWTVADSDGAFAVRAPASVVEWSAVRGLGSPRRTVHHVPGDPNPLALEVNPSGGIRFMVRDADTRELLTARLIVGRAESEAAAISEAPPSSAVRLLDALRGDASAVLPTGRYRVVATKGIEWSVDAREIHVVSGQADLVELSLRHVVPTPGTVSCDLHTHARPSFDSRASPEDTVVSLVAAGINFAVSTAHNVIGDYERAIAALHLGKEFTSVPGVEVTTYNPRFGHFGVFPASDVPPFEHTSLQSITRVVRADRSRYFQLNHPRLPGGIGYFDTIGLDPRAVRARIPERPDFDGIEVYNGFDIEHPARVEEVLRDYWALLDQGWHYTATGDSDSHCLQYHCVVKVLGHVLESGAGVGYPRTMVMVDPQGAAAQGGEIDAVDAAAIVENLKRGHATVTSGPLIDLALDGVGPGDSLSTDRAVIHGHLRVRAAPWIDVTQVQVIAGERGGNWRIVDSFEVPARPTQWGPGPGTLEQAQARAVRFDRDITVGLGPADGWVQAIARGDRYMSDVLPDVRVAPLAFTNPVYVVRPKAPPSGVPIR